MEGDFGWLWRNEELSDFQLVIRPVLQRHAAPAEPGPASGGAAAAAAAAVAAAQEQEQGGVQTRGKRRRAAAGGDSDGQSASAAPAAAGAAARGGRGRRAMRQHRGEEPAEAPNLPPQQQDEEEEQQQQQQRLQQQPEVQQPPQRHARAQAAGDGATQQQAHVRLTRRQQQQQQQQEQEGPLQRQQQQQQQQQQENQQQQQPGHQQQRQQQAPASGARRTRRQGSAAAPEPAEGRQQQPAGPEVQLGQQRGAQGGDGGGSAEGTEGAEEPTAPGEGRMTRAASRKQRGGASGSGGSRTAGQRAGGAAAAAQQQQPPPPAAAGRASGRGQQQAPAPASAAAQPGAVAVAATAPQQPPQAAPQPPQQAQQHPQEIRLPVHAVVLAAFSEYFKALICSWSGNLNRTITLDVGVDEGPAASLMVEFMYTGRLPVDAPPEELLRMVRLADQYQVSRFLSAASASFDSLPLSSVSLGCVLEVFALPPLILASPEMDRVVSKARSKLLELYGDLEKVWACESLREQFLGLPLPAVRCLLASESTAVASENTALVALAGWVDEGAGRSATPAQRQELLGLIRLPYLSSSFIGDVLCSVPWVREALDSRQLLNAFQFAAASESTRQRLATYEFGPSAATPHFRAPRPASAASRCTFEWSVELSTVRRMVADAKLWGRVVELSSPLHFFAGFWWQLLFNVERAPALPEAGAGAEGTAVEFVGVRCHVNAGAHDYYPRVVRFKASIAALQTGFWEMDYAYNKAIEGVIVDGVGLGYPGFFSLPGQALESEAAWSRFVRNGRVQLRCEVLDCE